MAYYEQSLSISQTQLIPVWVFVADLYTETVGIPVALQSTTAMTALVASDVNIYVPAADDPMALPQVTITSPAPGTIINTGQAWNLMERSRGTSAVHVSVDVECGWRPGY